MRRQALEHIVGQVCEDVTLAGVEAREHALDRHRRRSRHFGRLLLCRRLECEGDQLDTSRPAQGRVEQYTTRWPAVTRAPDIARRVDCLYPV